MLTLSIAYVSHEKTITLYNTPTLSSFCSVMNDAASTYRSYAPFSVFDRASYCYVNIYIAQKNLKPDFKNKNSKIFASRKTGVS